MSGGDRSGGPEGAERRIEQSIRIDAPAEVVWKALTDAQELMRWFPPEARVIPGEGGSVWMKWDDLMKGEYRISVWEPGEHLRVGFPHARAGDLVTDYFIEGKGGSTILRVVTSGFGEGEEWDDDFETIGSGWTFQLTSLRLYLERHRGKASRAVHIRRRVDEPGEQVWSRMVGAGRFFSSPALGPETDRDGDIEVSFAGGPVVPCRLYSWRPPRQVFGVLPSLGDALFRVEHLILRGRGILLVWLATYDVPDDTVTKLERRWTIAVDQALSA